MVLQWALVGGGSGGATVAGRLSEDPDVHVLLLEAGPAEYPEADIPANFPLLQNSPIDWKVRPEREEHCCETFINGVITCIQHSQLFTLY